MRLKWAFWDILRHFGTFRDNSEDILTSWDHLDCFPSHFRPFSPVIGSLKKTRSGRTDGRTDGPTDGRTDRPSYRDAWTHLKNISEEFEASIFLVHFIEKDVKDVKDVQDVQTEGTDPHIEMSVFMRVNIPAFTKNKENCFSRRPTISKKMNTVS